MSALGTLSVSIQCGCSYDPKPPGGTHESPQFIHESRDAPSHGGHAPLFSCPLHFFLPPPPLYSRHHHSPALLPSSSPSPKLKLSLRVALWTLHSPRPYSEDTP